jgi:hypothetical protein
LLVVTVTLLWQFGIFNKPAPAPVQAILKPVLPGVQQQGVLTIVEAIQSQDFRSAQVTYFTKNTPQGAKVMLRLVNTGNDGPFSEFPVSDKHTTVTVKTRIGNLYTIQSLEGYLSLNDTPLSPIETSPIQQASQNSSESSDPLPSASFGPSKKAYTSPSLVGTH